MVALLSKQQAGKHASGGGCHAGRTLTATTFDSALVHARLPSPLRPCSSLFRPSSPVFVFLAPPLDRVFLSSQPACQPAASLSGRRNGRPPKADVCACFWRQPLGRHLSPLPHLLDAYKEETQCWKQREPAAGTQTGENFFVKAESPACAVGFSTRRPR